MRKEKFKDGETVWFVNQLHSDPVKYEVLSGEYKYKGRGGVLFYFIEIIVPTSGIHYYINEKNVYKTKRSAKRLLRNVLANKVIELQEKIKKLQEKIFLL